MSTSYLWDIDNLHLSHNSPFPINNMEFLQKTVSDAQLSIYKRSDSSPDIRPNPGMQLQLQPDRQLLLQDQFGKQSR